MSYEQNDVAEKPVEIFSYSLSYTVTPTQLLPSHVEREFNGK